MYTFWQYLMEFLINIFASENNSKTFYWGCNLYHMYTKEQLAIFFIQKGVSFHEHLLILLILDMCSKAEGRTVKPDLLERFQFYDEAKVGVFKFCS